ncbi:hypothetical protein F4805DRAFT_463824 [Annulohypoxylon moriforme]|nr:hypothetical protein F4805DRAFT_463824 [Annulohypoxylon moriforme]
MAPPEEKLGDAITVKAPLPPLGSSKEKNQKKQLPEKKTARKTTTTSKSKHSPSVSRTSDIRSSLERTSISDTASLDQRLPKKPRLSNDADKPSTIPPLSSAFKPINSPERSRESVASDFALRPQKGNPQSLRADQGDSTAKSSNNLQAHKQQGTRNTVNNRTFPPSGVIDLTQVDEPRPRFPSGSRQGSHAETRKDRERPTAEPHARAGQVISDLPHEGRSIEVQTTHNGGTAKPNGNVGASSRDGQSYPRKTDPNQAPHPAPKKSQNINIAPRPVKPLLPPGFLFGTQPSPSTLDNDEQKTSQNRQNSQPIPTDIPRQNGFQNGAQAQQPTPVEPMTMFRFLNGSNTSTTSAAPGPSTTSNQTSTHGYRAGSIFTSNAQTNDVVHEIIENSTAARTAKTYGPLRGMRDNHLDALPSRPDPTEAAGRQDRPRSRSRESTLSKTQSLSESHVDNLHTSALSHNEELRRRSSMESPGSTDSNQMRKADETAVIEPTLEPVNQDQIRKGSRVDEKRQTLESKHDPIQFDSYIYGKNNEPFRPGSALFGLPPWKQPARPTRPATHYAHIDPRIHWSHPRSDTWYDKKRREIHERGNRKDNFGRAAARAAKRKREESNSIVSLPDRVKSNPQWLAALDELDEMAEPYFTHQREKFKERKRRKERDRYTDNIGQKEERKETNLIDEDGDYEMTDDPFDQRSTSKSPENNLNYDQLA